MEYMLARRLCQSYMKHLRHSGTSFTQIYVTNSNWNVSRRSLHCLTRCKLSQQSSGDQNNQNATGDKSEPSVQQSIKKMQTGTKTNSKGPTLFVIALSAIGFAGLYYINRNTLRKYEIAELKKSVNTGGEVLIGGEWTLTNHDGKTMTDKDFKDQWCIIYFGFTHCPDICPDEIEKIVEVTDILGRNKRLPKLKTLFITVDPDRDTPPAIKEYLSEFSDKIIGLTGSKEQLSRVYRAFKVYHSIGPKDEDGDYIVDHSIISYLMNPDGKYEAHFPRSRTNVEVAKTIEQKMNTWVPKG
ncbi:Cu-binding protein [Mactra antiquata]